jgi:hypothetical protein
VISLHFVRKLAIAGALIPVSLVTAQVPSFAGVFISVGFAPPAIPVYVQPPCPGDGYLWTPGYWNYADAGYYWVPGAWVQPPAVGLLWTPPYWGYAGGAYGFHGGYWGRTVGFYGGINYGFGYGGFGFGGGYWRGGGFVYNRAVANVDVEIVRNTYVDNANVAGTYGRTGFNGGPEGTRAYPSANDVQAEREQHFGATAEQTTHFEDARRDRSQYAGVNGGRPGTYALRTNRSGFGYGNEVNARQGNQQSRIANGIDGG